MSIEEIIKDLEHTIKYFEGCADKFQRGRKYQAMRTLEQLSQYNVVGRSEQLPILDRCECEDPNEEPIKVCMNCNGYVE